ncbi:MAG TPA: hypothetical protein VF329_01295 [Gammaproteobacteria bacterium]
MGDFIQAIEGSAIAVWVRESPSIFAYTTVLSLHAMGLAIVVGVGAAVSLRILGVAPGIPIAPLLKLFPVMWIGFTINAISGVLLLAARASDMLSNVMFIIKIVLIALAVISMELLRGRLAIDTATGQLIPSPRTRAFALSTLVLWIAAIIAGRLTSYPNFVASFFS